VSHWDADESEIFLRDEKFIKSKRQLRCILNKIVIFPFLAIDSILNIKQQQCFKTITNLTNP